MRRRWIILALLLPIYIAIIAEIGFVLCFTVLGSDDGDGVFGGVGELFVDHAEKLSWPFTRPAGRASVLAPAAVLAVTQLVFLLPVLRPRILQRQQGKPLLWSVIAAGFVGAMLTTGLFFTIVEASSFVTGDRDPVDDLFESLFSSQQQIFQTWLVWPFVLASWLLWLPLLIVFTRRTSNPRWITRIVTWLLAGTILELLIVVPLDIMVRRRTSCYCGTGTAFALCLSVCSLLWLSGPGIVLALTSKRRRWWLETHCVSCGYEKGPNPAKRCPECGYEWNTKKPNARTVKDDQT
jgi:hypothetical protein